MSDSKQTVQEIYAAFGRGDVPAILANLAEDVVWETEAPAAVSFGGIRHGKAGAKTFFEALANDQSNQRLDIAEIIASEDAVMSIGRYSATMKSTGKSFDTPIAHYWKFRDGKVVRYSGFINAGAVLDALQLSVGAAG